MKPQERIVRERVFGSTPDIVANRLAHTLNHLEEEVPMKRKNVSILAIVILLVFVGAAYAAISHGLKSYYETRFDYGGRLPEDVDERIQSNLPQSNEGNPLVYTSVSGAAWLGGGLYGSEEETLNLQIRATARDTEKYELVHGFSIDVDGARGEEERLEDPRYGDRADEPWMWAYDTYGPIDQVMKDPSKELLLFGNINEERIHVQGEVGWFLEAPSVDMFTDRETGEAVIVYSLQFDAEEMAALRSCADEQGKITLTIESWAGVFSDSSAWDSGESGLITFRIKLPETE